MLTTTYKLIHGDGILMAQPLLIKHYGRVGASLIQQIHYWSQKNQGIVHDNQRWIHNTIEKWAEQLCVSTSTIKRTVQNLLQDGVILIQKLAHHRSNRTNFYALNLEKLHMLAQASGVEEKTSENDKKAHQLKMTQSPDQTDPMVNYKLTHRDINNKSTREEIIFSSSVEKEKDEVVSQVEEYIPYDEKVEEIESTSQPRTTTVQDMITLWNNEVLINKCEVSIKPNRAVSKYLMACYKYKFNSDLDAWKHYCRLIASSPYLMSKDFVLSLNWAVKYTTIDRILAGELGVQLRCSFEKPKTEENLRAEALRHIDGVGESKGCKTVRRDILRAIGACQYNAWFTKVDILDDGLTLKPHNRFVEDYIKIHFWQVLEGRTSSC